MADGLLFALASIRLPPDAQHKRRLVESNVETCDFFIQMFGGETPEPLYQGFVEYAIKHALDPAASMTKVAVCFLDHASACDEMRAYRDALAARAQCELHDFVDESDLAGMLRPIL